jgi:hypothetical protein
MEEEKRSGNREHVVKPEDTRPVCLDANGIREILHELARRTAEMEHRLDRLLKQTDRVKRYVARDQAGSIPSATADDSEDPSTRVDSHISESARANDA